MKKAIAILLSSCMIACAVPNVALGASATMTVNTGTVVNKVPGKLFGVNTDWSIPHPAVSVNSSKVSANPNFLKAFEEYKLPLVRIGEGATPSFDWEKAIGDYASRPQQRLWGINGKVAAGPIELVNTFEQIDKNVSFTFTVDVMNSDYAAKAGRYAQFLTGGADTEYGKKRIEQGHTEPINVVLYELGNETDWGEESTRLTVTEYIKRCKETISAIKAVDPDAKFAAHINTTIYQAVNNPTQCPYADKAAWHRAILADSELMKNVSYLALHSYYGHNDSLMETLVSNIENDIKSSSFPNTKIFISEHALSYFDTTGDGVNDTNPSAMEGTIETAFTLQRLMAHSSVDMATFHAIYSNVWNSIWKNSTTGEIQLNSIGQLLNLFKNYGVGDLLSSSYSGFGINSDSSANGVAVRDSSGNINLIFTNNTSSVQAVTVSLSGTERYVISDEMKIVAKSGRSDVITSGSNGISINKYEYNKDTIFSGSYSVPAYSVCAVRLVPKAASEFMQRTLISENFNSIPNYTLPEGWEIMNGRSLAYAENGAFIVKADEYSKPVYIKIGGASQMKKAGLTVEADVTLIEQNEEARKVGARNKAGFAFVNGEQYSNGGLLTFYPQCEFSESGDANLTQGNVAYNSGEEFSSKVPVHLKLVFTDAAKGPDVYVNGVKQTYANKTSTNTKNGSVCLMVQAATVKFDNIVVTGEKCHKLSAPAAATKSFEYTQNFDNMADGSLPAGWTLYRNKTGQTWRTINAQVKNGALEFSENNKEGRGGYLIFDIPELANVNSKNLTMECDITLGNSLGVEIKEPTDDACVGFAYAFDESKITGAIDNSTGVNVVSGGVNWESAFRVRMYTNKGDDTTYQILESDRYNQDNAGKTHTVTSTVNKINTAGTTQKKLKIAVTNTNYCPDIYLDGAQVKCTDQYDYITPYRTNGKIGLYIKNTAVTIDNIKITGTGNYPGIEIYQSSFKTAGARYESVKAAKDDIVVKAYDYSGSEQGDVTSSATITGTDNGDGTGTINVSYGDYGERLSFSFVDRVTNTFEYTQNFDNIADGSLPADWTLYRNKSSNADKTIKAQVKNGALEITDNNFYSNGYLIFDIPGLADVKNQSLTMECDITLGNSMGIAGDNTESDCIGFAYGFDESRIDAKNITTDADGVKVISNGGVPSEAAFKVLMYTNKGADTANQTLFSEKFNQNTVQRYLDITSGASKINTAGTAQTMKLKINVYNQYYHPDIYLNGSKVTLTGDGYITPDRTSGKVGLYIKDTAVTIDNIKITGTGTYPAAATYKASFKTGAATYASVNEAKANVVVKSYNYFGSEQGDVTSSATITGTDNGDGTGTISVSYGDYSETLSFRILAKETRSFVYEENFDAMDDGSLPAGWTIYTPSAAVNTAASVSDGALTLTNTSAAGEWILFDALTSVSNKSLIMECDITHLDNAAGDENSIAGFAYMVDTGTSSTTNINDNYTAAADTTFTGFKGNYAALKTDSTNSDQLVSVRRQKTDRRGDVFTVPKNSDNTDANSGVTAMNKNNGNPIHLKIQYQNVKYLPYISINGVNLIKNEAAGFNDLYTGSNSDQAMLSGKVGFYIKNANVKIDNIKITGTKTDFVCNNDSIAMSNIKYDSANSKLNVMADASLTAASGNANSAIIAAVYDNSGCLLSTKTVDASNIADYHGTITLNGIASEPASGKVKLFFWDMTKLNPFTPAAVNK